MAEAYDDERLGFFVYGTLRPGYGNYRRYLSDVRHRAVPAQLAGVRMFATGLSFPYVSTKGARPEDVVVGAFIEVAPEHYEDALRRLDWLEGHPRHYTRTARRGGDRGRPGRGLGVPGRSRCRGVPARRGGRGEWRLGEGGVKPCAACSVS